MEPCREDDGSALSLPFTAHGPPVSRRGPSAPPAAGAAEGSLAGELLRSRDGLQCWFELERRGLPRQVPVALQERRRA